MAHEATTVVLENIRVETARTLRRDDSQDFAMQLAERYLEGHRQESPGSAPDAGHQPVEAESALTKAGWFNRR